MENKPAINTPDELQNNFNFLFEQFGISMQALQLQDLNSSEQALVRAKTVYRNISANVTGNENVPFQIVVCYIEIATRLLRSTMYSYDERFKKSLEELDAAKQICDQVNSSFSSIPKDFVEQERIAGMIDMFQVMFIFFERIVVTTRDITTGTIQKNEGRYVDEVKMFLNASVELRKMNDHNFGALGTSGNDFIVMMSGMLNRLAEVYEKRAERVEVKRKEIEFLTPIDKRVFIVHGHGEAILRELKEILKDSFAIEPIILSDELDNGDTVIEKFEHYGRLCAFAFVIVTPDDWVENKKRKYFQARPNVLFELGWFCGRYGRDKVRILRQKDTPLPSDLSGIVTIDFNERLEEVFRRIGRDLEAVGIVS